MIERDYLVRMISQLAAALAKILFAQNAQNYAEALQIAQSSKALALYQETLRRSTTGDADAEPRLKSNYFALYLFAVQRRLAKSAADEYI